jgi:hypothetical protein
MLDVLLRCMMRDCAAGGEHGGEAAEGVCSPPHRGLVHIIDEILLHNSPRSLFHLPRARLLISCQGGIAFGKKAKPSTPMEKLMHNDYMAGKRLLGCLE